MTPQDKKEIAASFMEHLDREELHTREAARFLNLNPCYCSMVKSEKSWDSMGKAPWERFMEWFNTRCNIRDFQIPEGEMIFVRKGSPVPEVKMKSIRESLEDGNIAIAVDGHAPETIINGTVNGEQLRKKVGELKKVKSKPEKKQKNGKSVKLVINTQEMADMRQKIAFLETRLKGVELSISVEMADIADIRNKLYVHNDEDIAIILKRVLDLERGMAHLVTIPKPEDKPGIIIFQRNIYKS